LQLTCIIQQQYKQCLPSNKARLLGASSQALCVWALTDLDCKPWTLQSSLSKVQTAIPAKAQAHVNFTRPCACLSSMEMHKLIENSRIKCIFAQDIRIGISPVAQEEGGGSK